MNMQTTGKYVVMMLWSTCVQLTKWLDLVQLMCTPGAVSQNDTVGFAGSAQVCVFYKFSKLV